MNNIKFYKKVINLNKCSNNDQLTISTYTFESDIAGPKIYIQSSLHGAEIQGNLVIFKIMEYLKNNSFSGSVTLVPQCNPLAANTKSGTYTKGRFHPITGENYNRKFFNVKILEDQRIFNLSEFVSQNKEKPWDEIKSNYKKELKNCYRKLIDSDESSSTYGLSEQAKLSLNLQILSIDSDIVLDLHTASVGTNHLYIAKFLLEKAKKLNFPFNIIIPNEFHGAFDEVNFSNWYSLYSILEKEGINYINDFQAYTLELGSEEEILSEKASIDAQKILNFLNFKKSSNKNEKSYSCKLNDMKSYYAPIGGLVEYTVSPGALIKQGELIARILTFDTIETKDDIMDNKCFFDVLAKQDGVLLTNISSGNVSEGTEIIQVLENLSIY